MIGRPWLFALGLLAGVAAHSGYSCVATRAGDVLTVRDDAAPPIDVPSAVATPRRPAGPAAPAERLPSAAEGDVPKGEAPTVVRPPAATSLPDLDELRRRRLELPVEGVERKSLRDSFAEGRTGHVHEAIDILAPRGTPIIAVEDGTIEKLFTSKQGGLTIYQFDPSRRYCYYYAHLDRYAAGLAQGQTVKRGQVIGYVGITGNAPPQTPHLHFTIFKLAEDKRWWRGTPLNPFPLWAAS